MGYLYFLVIACTIFGAMGLLSSFISEESDGSKLTAKAIRAVGFVLLASLLKSFIG